MKLKTKIKLSPKQITELALQCAIRHAEPKDIVKTLMGYFLSDTECSFDHWLSEVIPVDDNDFLQYLLEKEMVVEYFNNIIIYERTVASLKKCRIDTLIASPEWETIYRTNAGYYKNEEEFLKSEKEDYASELEEMKEYYEYISDVWREYGKEKELPLDEKGLPFSNNPVNAISSVYSRNYLLYKRILNDYDI